MRCCWETNMSYNHYKHVVKNLKAPSSFPWPAFRPRHHGSTKAHDTRLNFQVDHPQQTQGILPLTPLAIAAADGGVVIHHIRLHGEFWQATEEAQGLEPKGCLLRGTDGRVVAVNVGLQLALGDGTMD